MATKPDYIGKFHVYAKDWSRTDQYADAPQYPGQAPIRFPLGWTPAQCALAAHAERHGN